MTGSHSIIRRWGWWDLPSGQRKKTVNSAILRLASPDRLVMLLDKRIRPDMHPLSCFIRLLQALRMKAYRAKPSQFIRSKKSIFYEDNQTKAAAETEYILREQEEDGTWPVVWSWPDYPEAWAVGRMWRESHIVIENLRYLQGMGRLAIRD